MNKVYLILCIIVGMGTIIGASFIVDARFAKHDMVIEADTELSNEIAGVSKRQEQYIKQDRIRSLQEQMWALERHYGIVKAKKLGEYKRLRMERETLIRKLRR